MPDMTEDRFEDFHEADANVDPCSGWEFSPVDLGLRVLLQIKFHSLGAEVWPGPE